MTVEVKGLGKIEATEDVLNFISLTILEAASWREEKAWLAEKTGFPGKTKEAIEAAKEAFKESAEKYRSYGNQIYEALKAGGYYDRS